MFESLSKQFSIKCSQHKTIFLSFRVFITFYFYFPCRIEFFCIVLKAKSGLFLSWRFSHPVAIQLPGILAVVTEKNTNTNHIIIIAILTDKKYSRSLVTNNYLFYDKIKRIIDEAS